MDKSGSDGLVQVAFRLGDVLDAIAWQSPVSLSAVAREAALPKTTAHRLLLSLEQARMVVKTDAGYILGPRIDQWRTPLDQYQQFRGAIHDVLTELVTETRETASLFVGMRDRRVCWAVQEGDQEVRHVLKRDQSFPLGTGSGGKLILAMLPKRERERGIKATLRRFPHAIIPTISHEDWDAIKKEGFAISVAEREPGLASVSVLIRNWPMASLGLSGPAMRFSPERQRQFVEILRLASQKIDRLLDSKSKGGTHDF